MQHFRPGAAGKAARWTVAVVTFIVAVTFVALLYVWSEQDVAGLGDARDTLRDDAFFILAFFFTAVLTGAVLHTPFAVRRGGRIGQGWGVVAAFLVFGAVIAVIAALAAPHVPEFAPEHSSGRTDPEPGGWFGAVLICLLGGPAGVTWAGWIFSAPQAESERGGERALGPLAAGFGFTGLLGVPTLLLFVALLARHALPRGGLLPDGGGFFFVLGAVGAMGGVAAALVIAALRLFGGHRTRAAPPVGPLSPLAAAAYFAALGLLGMQLAHALPVTGVRIIGFIAMLVSSPVTVLIIGRSMKRSAQGEAANGERAPAR